MNTSQDSIISELLMIFKHNLIENGPESSLSEDTKKQIMKLVKKLAKQEEECETKAEQRDLSKKIFKNLMTFKNHSNVKEMI